jgi:hypothetical protein
VAVTSADTPCVSTAQPSCVRPGRRVQGELQDAPLLDEAQFPFTRQPTPMCTRRSGKVVPRCSWGNVAASCYAR